jgi:hypothetical protein
VLLPNRGELATKHFALMISLNVAWMDEVVLGVKYGLIEDTFGMLAHLASDI